MIQARKQYKIWLVRHRVDFRKGHNGLLGEAFKMKLDPFAGDVLIFIGRNRRKIKTWDADSTGLWVSSKNFTLESMKTRFKFLSDPQCTSITEAELAMILEGSAYHVVKKMQNYPRDIDNEKGKKHIS